MELKPRTKTEELRISAYGNDGRRFKELVKRLNEDLKNSEEADGEYTEEDVFAHILAVFFESKPEYRKLLKPDGRTLRHRQISQTSSSADTGPKKSSGNKRKGASKADDSDNADDNDLGSASAGGTIQ